MFFNTAIIEWVIGVVKILYKLAMLPNYIYPFLSVICLQITKNNIIKIIFLCFTCQVSINLNVNLFYFFFT